LKRKKKVEWDLLTMAVDEVDPPAGGGAAPVGAAAQGGAAPVGVAAQGFMLPQNEMSRLTIFRGTNKDTVSAEAWAEQVDRYVTVLKWNQEQTAGAAIEVMRDDANCWRENLANSSDPTRKALLKDWSRLRPEFITRFAKSRTRASKVQGFSQLKQQPQETSIAFNDRVVHALDKLTAKGFESLSQADIKGFNICRDIFEAAIYICGMKSDIRLWVEMEMEDDTPTSELRKLARKAEEAYNSKTGHPKVAALEIVHGTGDPYLETLKGELKDLKATIRKTIANHTPGQVAAAALAKKEKGGRSGQGNKRRTMPAMAERTGFILCWKCKQWGKHLHTECKLTEAEIERLSPQSQDNKPEGTVFDTQFPNC
jgi:hypothetical protein